MADLTSIARELRPIVKDDAKAIELAKEVSELLNLIRESDEIGHATIAGTQPHVAPPTPPMPLGGQTQFALFLYWVQHPRPAFQKRLDAMVAAQPTKVQTLWAVIYDHLVNDASSKITDPKYAAIDPKCGVVSKQDGTILGFGTYEEGDADWLWAFFNYLGVLVGTTLVPPFTPPLDAPPPFNYPLQFNSAHAGTVRIALVGDWGTGQFNAGGGYDPSASVMQKVCSLNPDYLIHLGDVYYAGTQNQQPPNEEYENFLKLWPKSVPPGRSFTLNSNHEMYSGANGYFEVALGRIASNTPTPFAHQNGYSYFALTAGDLAIVGLDSAYFDTSALYMKGALGTGNAQCKFLEGISTQHRRLILLTHHAPMTIQGTLPQNAPLWQDVKSVVSDGSAIELWYWGHIHMGILYGKQSAVGQYGIRAGCAGHGAVPMGEASDLPRSPIIEWRSNQRVIGSPCANRVRNGFAMLTIRQSDLSITEAFYDEGAGDAPVCIRTNTDWQ
jgi:Calcineurin-like phosphoesterase